MKEIFTSVMIPFAVALLSGLVLVGAGEVALATEAPTPTHKQTSEQVYQRLLSARFFAFGGVGFAGTPSEGERAFHTILASANALELFKSALTSTDTRAEASLYALCGIRRLAPEAFVSHARALVARNPKVRTMSGCIAMEDRASNIVARIAGGSYDLYVGNSKR
ncbi:MAG: hypothetical protein ABI651_19900 [Verrucomicrobiota bacterium]